MNIILPTKEVKLTIESRGKESPRKFGEGVYRFFKEGGQLLKARGWTEVKITRSYALMRLPQGIWSKPPFVIDVKISTREEVMAMAEEAHQEGKEWSAWVGEWAAGYFPSVEEESLVLLNSETGEPYPGQKTTMTSNPRFGIGIGSLDWHAGVYWENGVPRYHEKIDFIVGTSQTALPPETPISEDFSEGALHRVEQNQYERDKNARSSCIAHYGPILRGMRVRFW